MSYFISAIEDSNGDIYHYGTKRHSGRYPWGSGDNPYQHEAWFLGKVKELQAQGYTEKDIADWFNIALDKKDGEKINTTTLRAWKNIARAQLIESENRQILHLKDKGYSNVEIGERLGKNESVIRSRLQGIQKNRDNSAMNTAERLKERMKEVKYLDVGAGTEQWMEVSREKLNTAIEILKEEGYVTKNIEIQQMGTNNKTQMKVLCPEGTTFKELYANRDQIGNIETWTPNNGKEWMTMKYPVSLDSKRVMVRYPDEGGDLRDGIIQIRRGVADISLGESSYAQVRVAVDGTHYMKGIAMYAPDSEFPDGIDVIYNTHYDKSRPMLGPDNDHSVMKLLKDDPVNPFGATFKNSYYHDEEGNKIQSPMNLVNEEGKWGTWTKSLSSQFLSKQPVNLAEKQLKLDVSYRQADFDEIASIDNDIVRRYLLNKFADECDSAAVDLKAAAMPRQTSSAILPLVTLADNEIYAPNYKNGERVVLIRYPHAGKFEIPELIVNNKNKEGKEVIGPHARDAVGIPKSAAAKLSGADFDGDTVIVIPNNNGQVKTQGVLKELEGFDPQEAYKAYDGMPRVGIETGFRKGFQMGSVSNLITDMTIAGATTEELARADRHSMVVIDAEKHNLDWRASEIDNDIAGLKTKYQGGAKKGAATLISRASSPADVPERKELKYLSSNKMSAQDIEDFKAGKRVYEYTGRKYQYVDKKTGKVKEKEARTNLTKMEKVDDARELMSNNGQGSPIERVYADYANSMKAMAIEARRIARQPSTYRYNPEARKKYDKEYTSLKNKLIDAQKNSPLERAAQNIANIIVNAKIAANPMLKERDYKDDLTKIKNQAIAEGRKRTGADKQNVMVRFTDKEWEAVTAGAISGNFLSDLLINADMETVVRLATPRKSSALANSKIDRAVAMLNNGFTQAEVAAEFGITPSTLMRSLDEAKGRIT